MATQTVIWTALPNGVLDDSAGRRLRLSVLVSPRLRPAANEVEMLDLFPDFLAWPARMLNAAFEVAFDGGPVIGAMPVSTAPEPNLWSALFKPDTFVRSHEFDDHSKRQIVSYPVRQILDTLQRQYKRFALESSERLPDGRLLLGALDEFALEWNIDTELMARESLTRGQGISNREALAQHMLFHRSPALRAEDAKLPETEEDFRQLVDFHEAISSLGDYPSLMRRLGLILDLEIPVDDPPGGPIPEAGMLRLLPTWSAEGPEPLNYSPFTVYSMNETRFDATPRTEQIQDGYLALEPGSYGLVQVDVDGAVIKANHTALNLTRMGSELPAEAGLPSIRSGGFSLVRDGRAQQVGERLGQAATVNAAVESNSPEPPQLYAEDLVRGFRIDFWDTQTNSWHSLCRRNGTYRFVEAGIEYNDDDEGWVQLGAKTAPVPSDPTAPDDLYLHESLFRWDGWSLVAQRPGKAISRLADPAASPERPENEPMTPFKLVASFNAPPGSLPRLRFGTEYRIRARVADLAGNGPGYDTSSEAASFPASPGGFPYLRFDPVTAPGVVLRSGLTLATTPGEALERLVIRTFNSSEDDDATATTAVSERHIAPPRASQLNAEVHGKFDQPGGGLRVDPSTYAMIRAKDEGQFQSAPLDPTDPASQLVPVEPDAKPKLPYMPDPLALGAAFRDLPGALDGAIYRATDAGMTAPEFPPGTDRTGSVTLINFGGPELWPEALPFRLVMVEGDAAPTWDAVERVLTVSIAKSAIAQVPLSSYLDPADLPLMGTWQWIREEVNERARINVANPDALEELGRLLARVVQRTQEGGHWMITPARLLTLVHAVQQPLGHPRFDTLSAYRQENGATAAVFQGLLLVHGRSTTKVDLLAEWEEPVDRLEELGPRVVEGKATADEIPLIDLAEGLIRIPSRAEPIGIYDPRRDEVQFNADAHPRHEFGDTKHRVVRYRPVSTSRFREYFPPDVPGGLTRAGDEVVVDVPSSARPEAPRVLYVLPTFGWERQAETNLIASHRSGALRVYLDRPWFSSGADELLGVLYTSMLQPATPREERQRLGPYVTQWGYDPVHLSRPGTPALTSDHFPEAIMHGGGLLLPELPGTTLSVAAHQPEYAEDRQLWFCDITLNSGESYYPIVKLALARYQPYAMAGAELSRVVLANITQIVPDRSVVVTYDPYDPDTINVVVAGFTYIESREVLRTHIEVSGERQYEPELGELGWGFSPDVTVTSSLSQISETDALLWSGQVRLPSGRAAGEFRIMVKEYERYFGDGPPETFPPVIERLVYAEGLEV